MKKTATVLALAAAILAGGCENVKNEDAGVVVGGALGGLLGSQVGGGTGQLAATAAGALAGAYIGSRIGRSMDEVDRMKVQNTLENTPTGHSVAWSNPDSNTRYEVTPTNTYQQEGQPCRDYTTEAWIDGKREVVKGTACRQADGTWRAI